MTACIGGLHGKIPIKKMGSCKLGSLETSNEKNLPKYKEVSKYQAILLIRNDLTVRSVSEMLVRFQVDM